MKLAAIDIGSNAIRLQVTSTIQTKGQVGFKKLEYVRFPLRLGQDVFNTGTISPEKSVKFKKLMMAFKLLIDLYEVDDYLACATSAMREAKNGKSLVEEIRQEMKLDINIISGKEEASLINTAIGSFLQSKKNYLHIDVGGGSTEVTFIKDGIKTKSRSFKIGSVRRLEHHDSPAIWNTMKKWVMEHKHSQLTSVGTGGNINKLFELAGKQKGDLLSIAKLKEVQKKVRNLSLDQRINQLQLNPDRADVIVPASEIYLSVMEFADSKNIIVPDVGLKDGMMQQLYLKHAKEDRIIFLT